MGLADRACGCFDGLWLTDWWTVLRVATGTEILLLPSWVQSGSGLTKSPVQWEMGAISARIKRPGREAHRSPSFNAEAAIPAPHLCLFNEVHILA
jgi:hypothetical protein